MTVVLCFHVPKQVTCFVDDEGNKSDLVNEREVATSVGEEFARRHQMSFLETSALAADNVDVLFHDIARRLTKDAIRDGLVHSKRSDSTNFSNSAPVYIWPCGGCRTN